MVSGCLSGIDKAPSDAFPITNQTFTHNLQHGESIPVRFDTNGFRVPVSDADRTTGAKRPMLLFLGCSFTHGYGVYAQNTFAEQS